MVGLVLGVEVVFETVELVKFDDVDPVVELLGFISGPRVVEVVEFVKVTGVVVFDAPTDIVELVDLAVLLEALRLEDIAGVIELIIELLSGGHVLCESQVFTQLLLKKICSKKIH